MLDILDTNDSLQSGPMKMHKSSISVLPNYSFCFAVRAFCQPVFLSFVREELSSGPGRCENGETPSAGNEKWTVLF